MKDFLLSYDTVTLYPNHSSLPSRDKGDTSLIFCGYKFKLPVVPANMMDVIGLKNVEWLSDNGYFYIYHRFGEGKESTLNFIKDYQDLDLISISVGVNQESINIVDAIKGQNWRVDFITVDVAHADHENVKRIIAHIRETLPSTKLIVGNVATKDGVAYLCELGVDAIKVGIGGGSICTTRYMTGFHIPTLQSVAYANEIMMEIRGWDIPIIADGGAKHYGDVAKAIRFGATMVMSGGWFASCIDSPAKIVDGKKLYRGSTSYELKGKRSHVEGRQLELLEGTTYEQRLTEIKEAIQSSISYAGGENLAAFLDVEFGRIPPYS